MLLRVGSHGSKVKMYKDMLFILGYLKASTHDRFGHETLAAVKAFQSKHQLEADGIIGNKTAAALKAAYDSHVGAGGGSGTAPSPEITWYVNPADYGNLDPVAVTAINSDLQDEADVRRQVVKEALFWAFPYGLYIFGANLYKKDLTVQVPSLAYINARAKKHPEYFDGGRKEFMAKQYTEAAQAGRRIGCADCSGYVVGVLRKLAVVHSGFDTTANGFFHNYCIKLGKKDLKPGDLVFRRQASGFIPHMGLYAGAGYVVEAAGGAFGIQLSRLDDHILKNQMTGQNERRPAWTLYGGLKLF
jgi:hypothetical protein